MVIYFGISAKIVAIKAAFLYGDLKEEINMERPQGMTNVGKSDCVVLDKYIYGLVQALRQYYKNRQDFEKSRKHWGQCQSLPLHKEKCEQ